jgi:hypothetical protein
MANAVQGVGMAGNALANSSSGTSTDKTNTIKKAKINLLRVEIFTQFKINNYGKSNR